MAFHPPSPARLTGKVVACATLAASMALGGCGVNLAGMQAGEAGGLRARAGVRPWAYLQVAALDNPLTGTAASYAKLFEAARTAPNVQTLAIVDEQGADNTHRFSLGISGNLAKDKLAEADSASARPLTDLLMHQVQTAPAQRRVLALTGHGGGVLRGLLADENGSAGKLLPVSQLAAALRSTPVDILYLDADFMQSVEVAYELQGAAEIIVGSESEVFAAPEPHEIFVKQLQEISGTVPADAAAVRVVQAAGGAFAPDGTFSAVRGRRLANLISGLARLSNDLTFAVRNNPGLRANIRQAIANSQSYLGAADPRLTAYNSYRDLGDVLANIAASATPDLQKQIYPLLDDLHRNVVAAKVQGGRYGRSTGLAIYAPAHGEVSATYMAAGFASYTRWSDFLVALNANAPWHNPVVPDRTPAAFHSRLKLGAAVAGQAPIYEIPGFQPPALGYPGYGATPGYPGTQPGYPGTQPGYPGTQPGYPGTQPGYPGTQPGYPGYPAPGPTPPIRY
ncbi:MAG: hypothetical protein FJZ01_20675 [Candidatus Sericytochromatia bacterium]|nr:hypothetical protein [Candidatus Tanganyikabacteria bacterium]